MLRHKFLGGKRVNEEQRKLYEGYLALRSNPCFLQLTDELRRKRDYYFRRLLRAEDWSEYCLLRGGIEAVESLLGLVAGVAQLGKERREKGADICGDEGGL